jgi:hypothetical protein
MQRQYKIITTKTNVLFPKTEKRWKTERYRKVNFRPSEDPNGLVAGNIAVGKRRRRRDKKKYEEEEEEEEVLGDI